MRMKGLPAGIGLFLIGISVVSFVDEDEYENLPVVKDTIGYIKASLAECVQEYEEILDECCQPGGPNKYSPVIEEERERYDYILIDCMPSLDMITINAFACADSILIPVQAAYLPVKGLEQLIKTIGKVKRQINPKLSIEGILLTMVDSRTNYAKDISALLIENYGSKVRIFENSIPISVRAAEISAEGVSIYQHDPKGKVASAYQSLMEEVRGNE